MPIRFISFLRAHVFPWCSKASTIHAQDEPSSSAVGSVLLAYLLYRVELRLSRSRNIRIPLTVVVVVLELIFFNALIPAYGAFQDETLDIFDVADAASGYYVNGTIVCDHPTANYRLVSRWGVNPENLLSNHYAPNNYGETDPARYANWFTRHNVTLWLHCGSRSHPVWTVVSREYPDARAVSGSTW